MPRAANGTCTLVAENPVTGGTAITVTWANNTLNDIITMLSDSLSRSGNGGMQVSFQLADGTLALPALAFTSEPASGVRRAGANDVRLVINATDIAKLTAAGLTILSGAIDAATIDRAGTIAIGGTAGTTLSLGRAGQVATVASTLDAAVIDRAGTISIGATSGTGITIGRAGQSVTFPGTVSNIWNQVVATGDTSCSSDVTAVDVSGLSFAAASGKKYLVRGILRCYAAATTTGIGFSFKSTDAPTTSTCEYSHSHWGADVSTGKLQVFLLSSAFADLPTAFPDTYSNTAAQPQADMFEGYFVTTGTGTFQLRIVSEVNTSAVTVKAGSYLEWLEFT